MFSKFLSFILVFTTLIVQAEAASHQGLKAAFEDLNYSLNVEWDQKDKEFFNAQSEKFSFKLRELQKQGLSNQEMLNAVLAEVKDKNVVRDIETTFTMVAINQMSSEDAISHIKSILEKSHTRGASWNGGYVFFGMVLMIAIIAVVGLVYQEELKEEGERCYMAWKCNDHCTLKGCVEVCGEECI